MERRGKGLLPLYRPWVCWEKGASLPIALLFLRREWLAISAIISTTILWPADEQEKVGRGRALSLRGERVNVAREWRACCSLPRLDICLSCEVNPFLALRIMPRFIRRAFGRGSNQLFRHLRGGEAIRTAMAPVGMPASFFTQLHFEGGNLRRRCFASPDVPRGRRDRESELGRDALVEGRGNPTREDEPLWGRRPRRGWRRRLKNGRVRRCSRERRQVKWPSSPEKQDLEQMDLA